ncbi:MAG: hypothetical protein HQL73_13580 [Magnetococcales bacterium]|nr:hypothetical protein [Magnetococcales bacterium]
MTTTYPTSIQVFEKDKLRLVDTELLRGADAGPYQKRHQLSEQSTFDDGQALLEELRMLAFARRQQGHGIMPEELLPFLEDINAVLVRGGSTIANHFLSLELAQNRLRGWLGPKMKCW